MPFSKRTEELVQYSKFCASPGYGVFVTATSSVFIAMRRHVARKPALEAETSTPSTHSTLPSESIDWPGNFLQYSYVRWISPSVWDGLSWNPNLRRLINYYASTGTVLFIGFCCLDYCKHYLMKYMDGFSNELRITRKTLVQKTSQDY